MKPFSAHFKRRAGLAELLQFPGGRRKVGGELVAPWQQCHLHPLACSLFTGNLVVFLPQTSQCHTFPLSHPRSSISKNILEDHTGLVANADLCLWVFYSLWAAFDLKSSFLSRMRSWSRDQGLAVGSCWLALGRTFGPKSVHVLGFCLFEIHLVLSFPWKLPLRDIFGLFIFS